MLHKRIQLLAFSVVASLLVAAVLPGAARALELKKAVTVTQPPLTLKDVARGKLGEGEAGIRLGPVPRPGSGRFISRAYIIMKARSQNRPIPRFEGDVIRSHVQRPLRILRPNDLRPAIRSLLKKRLAVSSRTSMELTEMPPSVRVIPGPWRLSLDRRRVYRSSRGTGWFRFEVEQKGSVTARFRVRAEITQIARVPVAVRPLSRGTVLTEDHIRWQKRDVGTLRSSLISEESRLFGLKTKHSFQPGEIITRDALKRPVLIRRGDRVTIRLRRGSITIRTKGKALENGSRSDTIYVLNPSSDRRLRAEVINKRTVYVNDPTDS